MGFEGEGLQSILHTFVHIKRHIVQIQLSRLNLGEVQNVVNNGQQGFR